jgi:hypothetical protein
VDASTLRAVPDNQEVWLHRDGDQSVIVEIVEAPDEEEVAASGHGSAALYHFADIAAANAAAASAVTSARQLDGAEVPLLKAAERRGEARAVGTAAWLVQGTQRVAKYRGDASGAEGHDVALLLAVVRLPAVGTDILVTWHVPPEGRDPPAGSGAGSEGVDGLTEAQAGMAALLEAFQVVDYGLFTP